MKATAHSAMTRPRIWGSVSSCNVELAIDKNETLANPTSANAKNSIPILGESAAKVMKIPKSSGGANHRPGAGPALGR